MIYIITGAPGEGKSFYGSYLALEELKHGRLKTMTNYPVIYERPLSFLEKLGNYSKSIYNKYYLGILPYKSGYHMGFRCRVKRRARKLKKNELVSTYVWKDEYMNLGLHGWVVILDEAYTIVSCRDYKNFDVQKHTFFATNRHDENYFYFLTQHFSRVDTIIREMANYYIFVRKKTLLWSDSPLFFILDFFVGKGKDGVFDEKDKKFSDILSFKKDVKKCYDTHYFKHDKLNEKYETWLTKGFKLS